VTSARPARTGGRLAAACLLLAACNASTEKPNPMLSSNTDAAVRRDVGIAPGTINVEITSPADGSMLTTSAPANILAKITVVGNGDFIDPTSVVAKLTPEGASNIVGQTALVGPVGSDQYKGELSLAGLKLGRYILTVSASTTNGASDQAQVKLSLDNGPQIIVLSPLPGGHYKGGVVVQVVADPGAYPPLDNLMGTAGGIPLQLAMDDPNSPTHYDGLIDFHQPVPPLMGPQLFVISATNSNGARTEVRFVFVVDEQGPTIQDTTPVAGTILGPVVRIAAHISDDAGLDEASLVAILSDKLTPDYVLHLQLDALGFWSVLFDSHTFPSCKLAGTDTCVVRPTLSFRAADQLGNQTTVTYQVALDNITPVADLVPPPVRDQKIDQGTYRCSHLFDPLSNDARAGDMPNDGCMVPQTFDLRARIEDDGNRAVDLKQVPISLVDPDNTAVYVLDDPGVPLVVDTDADGYCDAINPDLVPTTMPLSGPRQVLKVRLAPVVKGGAADFTMDPSATTCASGLDLNPPLPLCIGGEPTIAISYSDMEPAIWSLEPIDHNYCFGPQFDAFANNVSSGGWKCIAVATKDLNGNASTSVPIRVWVDYNYNGQPANTFCHAPPASAGPPPTCTGAYDLAAQKVVAGTCKARKFPPGELCLLGNCGVCPTGGCAACSVPGGPGCP